MAARTEGVIAKFKREQREEGIKHGEKNIILELLKDNTLNEVSQMIHKEKSEIQKIIGID